MKRFKTLYILFILILFAFPSKVLASAPPEITSGAAILADVNSGEILYEKNPNQKMYPASTTKIMTGLLAVELGNLEDEVKVESSALEGLEEMGSPPSMKVGQVYKIEDLVKYLLIASSNDAANIIAEHISGNTKDFVKLMNDKAKEIGMKNTHYSNAHGLHDDDHYTTAYDLYLLTKESLKNEKFAEITSMKQCTVAPVNDESAQRTFFTTNSLISKLKTPDYYYKYAHGVKTGFTTPAGHCLSSEADKNGRTLICVVMGAPEDPVTKKVGSFVDSKNLYEWGFSSFSEKTLVKDSDPIVEIPVGLAKDQDYVVLTPQESVVKFVSNDLKTENIKKEITTEQNVKAPLKKGQVLGKLTLTYDGHEYAKINLVAMNDVEVSQTLYYLDKIESFFANKLFKMTVLAAVVFVIIMIIFTSILRGKRNRYKNRYRRF